MTWSSSLEVLEEFYGEALSDELLQRIYATDDEQLAVLAFQLLERLPIVEAEIATPWNPLYARRRASPVMAHEGLLTQLPFRDPLASQTLLHRSLLYLDTLVVRDPLLMWAEAVRRIEAEEASVDDAVPAGSELGDADVPRRPFEPKLFEYFGEVPAPRPWGPTVARVAAGLLPLRPLLTAGVIRLVSAPRISWRDAQPLMSNNVAVDAVIASKPNFVRQVMSEHPDLAARYDPADDLDRYILCGLILTRHEDHFKDTDYHFALVASQVFNEPSLEELWWDIEGRRLPPRLDQAVQDLRRLLSFDDYCQVQDMVPVAATDPGLAYFLPGRPERDAWVDGAGRVERLLVPTVLTGIDDLVRLRLAEESFELFRQGMLEILTQVGSVNTPADGLAMSHLVADTAGEVFPPIIERLDKLELTSTAISAMPKAAKTMVGVGARVLAMMNPGLFAAHTGFKIATKAAGEGASYAVKSAGPLKKAALEREGSEIARRIAISISTVG